MRTTVELDDDLFEKLKKLAHIKKTSLREEINETLRRGLIAQVKRSPDKAFQVTPFHSAFRPGVDPLRLNHLNDELDFDHKGKWAPGT